MDLPLGGLILMLLLVEGVAEVGWVFAVPRLTGATFIAHV